ncbi:hypothetical protein [Burkholderia glumae]
MDNYEDLTAALLATSADSNATKLLLIYTLTFLQKQDSGFLPRFVDHCDASIDFAQAAHRLKPSDALLGLVSRLRAAATATT